MNAVRPVVLFHSSLRTRGILLSLRKNPPARTIVVERGKVEVRK